MSNGSARQIKAMLGQVWLGVAGQFGKFNNELPLDVAAAASALLGSADAIGLGWSYAPVRVRWHGLARWWCSGWRGDAAGK